MMAPASAILLGLAGARPGAATAQAGPAGEILARGSTVLPPGDVAGLAPDAAFERRSLGFAIPPFGEAILVTDEATGSASRVEWNGASFVREGTIPKRESLGRTAARYLRLGLVPFTRAQDAGGDRPRFAGGPFAAPEGERLIGLARYELSNGDLVEVAGAAGEALIHPLQGSVTVESPGGEETLDTVAGSDTYYDPGSCAGDLTIRGRRDATDLLAATIGDVVAASAEPSGRRS